MTDAMAAMLGEEGRKRDKRDISFDHLSLPPPSLLLCKLGHFPIELGFQRVVSGLALTRWMEGFIVFVSCNPAASSFQTQAGSTHCERKEQA
jgi:hypothetical protein